MSDEEAWTWQFRAPAKRTYDGLDEHAQDRITDKLDEIVTDQWRDPDDYLEPLYCRTEILNIPWLETV